MLPAAIRQLDHPLGHPSLTIAPDHRQRAADEGVARVYHHDTPHVLVTTLYCPCRSLGFMHTYASSMVDGAKNIQYSDRSCAASA